MPKTPIFAKSAVVRSYADASAHTKLVPAAGTYTEHRKMWIGVAFDPQSAPKVDPA
jgi:hypothetical protein